MLVSKKFKWTDENGKAFNVSFGADAENVTVNGEKLTKVIDDINVSITKQTKFSTIPQKIGEWIDGTPVWKVAFQKEFDEIDREDKNSGVPLPIINPAEVFVVNTWAQAYNSSPSIIDDVPLNYEYPTMFAGSVIADTRYAGMYGWVEFVTPESNIKTA